MLVLLGELIKRLEDEIEREEGVIEEDHLGDKTAKEGRCLEDLCGIVGFGFEERRTHHDPNILGRHLVDVLVLDDLLQARKQSLKGPPIQFWQLCNQPLHF